MYSYHLSRKCLTIKNTKMKHLFLVFTLFTSFGTILAQNATKYVIQLGAMSSIDIERLHALSDIGNVYFNPTTDSPDHEVLLGSFDNASKAEAVIQSLKSEAFHNVYAAPLPITKGIEVHVIQLAQFHSHEDINWGRFQGHGKIYTTIEQGKFSVVTGIFPDYQSSLTLQDELFKAGFTTAEVIKINSIYLHEVNLKDIAFQQKLQERPVGKPSEFTAKGGPMITPTKEETPPIVSRIALSKSIAPAINEDLARNSVKNLQSVLLVLGSYTEEPNGLYDDKTANAYYASVQLNPTLKKYSLIAEGKSKISSGYFTDWNDIQLLLAIANDISGQEDDFSDAELKALISLYKQPKVLGAADAKKVINWKVNLINQFEQMQKAGALDSETHNAFMLATDKVQILLEDYYLNKGFSLKESTDLAKATIYALLVGKF